MAEGSRDSLGDRMKMYEDLSRTRLMPKQPVIVRLDGKAFHTLTQGMKRPWDLDFMSCMKMAALSIASEAQGCQFAYVQSDEISLLLTDWKSRDSQSWFDNDLRKIISVSAAITAVAFTRCFDRMFGMQFDPRLDNIKPIAFDSRAWNLPEHEVQNYFVWRQQDATRNSISMLAQSHFSHKELHGVNSNQMQDMLFKEKRINWNETPTHLKRGYCVVKEQFQLADGAQRSRWTIDNDIPVFSADPTYVTKHLQEKSF